MERIKAIARTFGVDVRRAPPTAALIERPGVQMPMRIIEQVFAFFDRVPYFYRDPPEPLRIAGAWRDDLIERRQNQIRLIETRDAGYAAFASRMMFNELVSGLWNYGYFGSRATAHDALVRSIAEFTNTTGLPLDVLHARTPLAVWGASIDGSLVTNVSVSHAAQAWAVANLIRGQQRATVIDLGSGFGGMAEKLAELHAGAVDIWLLDIPANLTTAYLYLASRFEGVQLLASRDEVAAVGENTGGCRFLLAPTIYADAVPHADVLHNAGSFSEMDAATVAYYLETIRASWIIETNSNRATVNTAGHQEVLSSRFPIPASHRLIARYSPIDREASGGRYLTSIYHHATR